MSYLLTLKRIPSPQKKSIFLIILKKLIQNKFEKSGISRAS